MRSKRYFEISLLGSCSSTHSAADPPSLSSNGPIWTHFVKILFFGLAGGGGGVDPYVVSDLQR